jgi:probable phosphoglycerate mutase
MLSILLIRAGTTEYESQGRIQGALDVPLSEGGRKQVEQTASELTQQSAAVETLYAAPGRAAQQTAEILSQRLGLKFKTLKKLDNLNQGLWQGMLVEEVRAKQPKVFRQWQENPETVCPPKGETVQSARERLQEVLGKLARKHKRGQIAMVVSEPLASLLRGLLTNEGVTDLWPVIGAPPKGPPWERLPVPSLR